jgi:hypothetical protein
VDFLFSIERKKSIPAKYKYVSLSGFYIIGIIDSLLHSAPWAGPIMRHYVKQRSCGRAGKPLFKFRNFSFAPFRPPQGVTVFLGYYLEQKAIGDRVVLLVPEHFGEV